MTTRHQTSSVCAYAFSVLGFPIYVMGFVDGAEAIKVYGQGVNAGILAHFNGEFCIDTENAGRGQCAVKILGPKG